MGITKKQREVFDYIVEYCHVNNYSPTQKEIKDFFGFKSFGSVQRYIKYLIEADYLCSGHLHARRGLTPVATKMKAPRDHSHPSKGHRSSCEIPLLGLVAAGNPIEALENPSETIPVDPSWVARPGYYFALKITGDSMVEAGIFERDIIVCRQEKSAQKGQTVVAIIEGEATVKKFYPDHKNNTIELHPANHTLSPIVLREGDFQLAGVLIGLMRSYPF